MSSHVMNLEGVGALLETYSINTGLTFDLVDRETGELLAAVGVNHACLKFHLASPKSSLLCKGKPVESSYEYPTIIANGCGIGLSFGSAVVWADGAPVAELYGGPVLFDYPDADMLKKYMEDYRLDEEWLNSYLQLPVIEKSLFVEYVMEIAKRASYLMTRG